jgi:putative hemolysin
VPVEAAAGLRRGVEPPVTFLLSSPDDRQMSDELSYAFVGHPRWKRWTIRAIENLSGRRRILPIYARWREHVAGKHPRMMQKAFDMIGTTLDIEASAWPVVVPPGEPLVIVANHPFGIGDGLAVLSLAEALDRPYRILVNSDFMNVPEFRPYSLPIDFSNTREAIDTNLKSRAEARRLLKEGVTIVVFPAGGVATADRIFGRAEELPWKPFVARLVQQAGASVLPVFIDGQNSALFHLVSRYSLTLRLSLLVSEFRHVIGASVKVRVGALVPFADLAHAGDRRRLTEELYVRVHRLAPGASGLSHEQLKPPPPEARRRYPWERTVVHALVGRGTWPDGLMTR